DDREATLAEVAQLATAFTRPVATHLPDAA
ncbi:MAG: hypothetical protein QOK36_2642, partial [Gaiellales bacterium]|nr:hypothetical protein [Gaiellales bacterium]